jgi:DNA-directed RNA polymerase specialized sigma24 family protein
VHFDAPASDPGPEGFESWEIDAAQAVVASFVAARGGFRTHRFEELLQEGLMVWWEQRGQLDERRASKRTFLGQVITSRLLDLLKAELVEKRGADRMALSLDLQDWDLQRAVEDVQVEEPNRQQREASWLNASPGRAKGFRQGSGRSWTAYSAKRRHPNLAARWGLPA